MAALWDLCLCLSFLPACFHYNLFVRHKLFFMLYTLLSKLLCAPLPGVVSVLNDICLTNDEVFAIAKDCNMDLAQDSKGSPYLSFTTVLRGNL